MSMFWLAVVVRWTMSKRDHVEDHHHWSPNFAVGYVSVDQEKCKLVVRGE